MVPLVLMRVFLLLCYVPRRIVPCLPCLVFKNIYMRAIYQQMNINEETQQFPELQLLTHDYDRFGRNV
jgi:hypothetical protein